MHFSCMFELRLLVGRLCFSIFESSFLISTHEWQWLKFKKLQHTSSLQEIFFSASPNTVHHRIMEAQVYDLLFVKWEQASNQVFAYNKHAICNLIPVHTNFSPTPRQRKYLRAATAHGTWLSSSPSSTVKLMENVAERVDQLRLSLHCRHRSSPGLQGGETTRGTSKGGIKSASVGVLYCKDVVILWNTWAS